MRLVAVLLSLSLLGCDGKLISSEYEFVQKENGLGMRAPITYRIRYQWSGDTLAVNILVTDVDGRSDIRNDVYHNVSIGRGGYRCEKFNDSNWSCSLVDFEGKVRESWTMKDGVLSWLYWGQERELKKRYRMGDRTLPI